MRIREVALVVLLEKISRVDPEKSPFAVSNQLPSSGDLLTDQTHHRLGLAPAIAREQHEAIRSSAGQALDAGDFVIAEKLVERTARQPCKTLAAGSLGHRDQLIQLASSHVSTAWHGQRS